MDILLTIMAFFGLIGLIDDLIGGKIGVSDEFNRGLASMGSLAIAYSGFYCIGTALIERNAQSIAQVTSNLPFDPSLITSCLLCADTGGLNIALALSNTQALGIFCGALIGGGLGLTIGFQMPVFMSTLDKRFLPQFMQGIGYGLIALPAGLIVGGFLLGLSVMELLINLTPVVVLCIVLIFAFKINLDKSVRVLIVIANAVRIVSYIFFGLVVVGLFVPQLAIADTSDVEEIIYAVLRTTVVTAGGLVMSKLVIRYCQKPLSLFTRILRVNNESVIGLLVSCVSGVAMIPMIPKMDRRGQVMNAAFVVCGAYVIGGQMAFVSQMIPASSMPAFMLNKLILVYWLPCWQASWYDLNRAPLNKHLLYHHPNRVPAQNCCIFIPATKNMSFHISFPMCRLSFIIFYYPEISQKEGSPDNIIFFFCGFTDTNHTLLNIAPNN